MKINHKAFTLAEILITLGIVGIVAATTLPVLHSKYEKHIIETGLKKTYSDLENLIKRSEADNGSYETWDYAGGSKQFIEKYFAPYINLSVCGNGKLSCFAGTAPLSPFYIWKIPNGDLETGGAWRVADKYLLDDGRSIAIMIIHTPVNNGYWDYVTFVVDVNGKRGKSIMGQDVFTFTLFNYLRYGSSGMPIKGFHMGLGENDGDFNRTTEDLYNWCSRQDGLGATKCGLLIQRNGWKFPKDYPIKF